MKRVTTILAMLCFALAAPAAFADETCDYDGSGVCDADDQAIIMAAQGTQVGEAGYEPAADHDGDGVISLADLAIFLQLRDG